MITATGIVLTGCLAWGVFKTAVEVSIDTDSYARSLGQNTPAENRAIGRDRRKKAREDKLRLRLEKQCRVAPDEYGIRCNSPSPDGVLLCRLECGHPGWHTHHGPISWYFDRWSEDEYAEFRGQVPW